MAVPLALSITWLPLGSVLMEVPRVVQPVAALIGSALMAEPIQQMEVYLEHRHKAVCQASIQLEPLASVLTMAPFKLKMDASAPQCKTQKMIKCLS